MSDIAEKTKDVPTYIKVGSEDASLELDLITFREKGKEARYLSVSFTGVDITKEPNVIQEAFVNIDEEDFNRIKMFFQQLEWNK